MHWETSWCVPAKQTRQAVLIRLFQVINQVWNSFWTCLLHSGSFSFTIQAISGDFLGHYTGDDYLDIRKFNIRVDSTLSSVKRARSHWLVSAVCTLCVACTWLEPAFRCKVGYCNTLESWRDLVLVGIWLQAGIDESRKHGKRHKTGICHKTAAGCMARNYETTFRIKLYPTAGSLRRTCSNI